uniref:CAF1B/HIR1 beta-propeller domain-containing protein n=1 Tax=Ciona savignyi TaxID=51511 RepID=H2YPZ4_CIOSA
MVHCVSKMKQPAANQAENEKDKMQRIFHDESVVRRRLSFSPDGKMLMAPAGCLQVDCGKENQSIQQINTTMIFPRGSLSKPVAYLPGLQLPSSIVCCSPCRYKLMDPHNDPPFKMGFRYIFAVASSDTVVLYDTQHPTPFAVISNIHYASITDLSWSSDGLVLAVSSRDGFCSLVEFDHLELGEIFTQNPETIPEPKKSTPECPPPKLGNTPMDVTDIQQAGAEEVNNKEQMVVDTVDQELYKETENLSSCTSNTPRRVKLTPVSDNSPGNSKFSATKSSSAHKKRRIPLTVVDTKK